MWFVPDTAITAYYRVDGKVALNVAVALLVYISLFATRRQFMKGLTEQTTGHK